LTDQNPLDLGAAVTSETVGPVLRAVLAAPSVDMVLTVFTEIAITDAGAITDAVCAVAGDVGKPVVAVTVGQPPRIVALPGSESSLPIFTFPEAAAAALGAAYRYSQWRQTPPELPTRPPGVDPAAARAVAAAALDAGREWLTADETHRLLSAYRVPVSPQAVVDAADDAVAAATTFGYPVVLKLAAPGLHKSDIGGVRVGIGDETQLRAAVHDLDVIGGGAAQPLIIQPMAGTGTELIVGAVHDARCGPLIMVGAGGVFTEVLGDRSFGLAPLTDGDAERVLGRLRSAALLDGYRGVPSVPHSAVTDVLVRVAALVDDVPEIAELDLNPLICRSDGVLAVDARIRVAPAPLHADPLVRQLRGGTATQPEAREHGASSAT
jgi:acyl-CoA synthetase (NDP forming)